MKDDTMVMLALIGLLAVVFLVVGAADVARTIMECGV